MKCQYNYYEYPLQKDLETYIEDQLDNIDEDDFHFSEAEDIVNVEKALASVCKRSNSVIRQYSVQNCYY